MSIYDDTVKHLLDFQEIQIHHFNNSWISFDVTAPVNDILQMNSKTKYLKIVVMISAFLPKISDNLKLSLMPIEEDYEHDYPVLLLTYSSTKEDINDKVKEVTAFKNKRRKRNANYDYDEEINEMWNINNQYRKNKFNNVTEKNNTLKERINKLLKNNIALNEYKTENNRKKRNIEDDYEEETNRLWDDDNLVKKTVQLKRFKRLRNTCRRRPLYVDFAEIKYDSWIVQPSGYEVSRSYRVTQEVVL